MQKPTPKHDDNSTNPNWLDKLQQESWQLELLISGFSIFLLIGAWTKHVDYETDMILLRQASDNFSALEAFYEISRIALACLLATLAFHVLLRGMWIAAIGLRSVSGDIEYEELGLLPRFQGFLERRIGSFDAYIERLERNCSVLFTVAFLIFFGLLSFALLISVINIVFYILITIFGDTYSEIINNTLSILLLLVGVPYLLDFMTLGWLKKRKWLVRPYYYISRLMGWLTLARFSRPLYYNLVDNRFGRRLAIALPIVMFGAIFLYSYEHVTHAYYPSFSQGGKEIILSGVYEDDGFEDNARLWRPSLASRYVRDNYLELFIPYIPVNDDETLEFLYPDVVPARLTGTVLRRGIKLGEYASSDASNTELRETISSLWRISLDSIPLEVTPRFSTHKERRQLGLVYMVPAHDLPVGEHELLIQKRMHLRDTVRFQEGNTIYFYK